MRLFSVALTVLATAIPTAVLAPPAQAAVAIPGAITAVSAVPGPYAGQVTFSWTASGTSTTSFQIETGLTTFKVGDPVLPDHGRGVQYFTLAPTRRSITLTAAQVALAGARAQSANHLYYRFKAVNRTAYGTAVRSWPYLQNVAVRPGTPSTLGTGLRVASFNVRTATNTAGVRPWLQRVPGIAKTILSRNPGVVAVQELGINRADGTFLSTTGAVTQADSLVSTLAAQGGSRYKLVRRSRFVPPGTPEANQGARILYDTTRYSVVSSCPETSDGKALTNSSYSTSCTIFLPHLSTDSAWTYRRASYALMADRATGKRFWVASAHLDQRHSTVATTERTYETLRANQVKTVMTRLAQLNTAGLPIVLAGDLNTYQNNQGGYDAHDALVAAGYYDTSAATVQVNRRYTTMNHFYCTLGVPGSGWGSRLDVVTVKGVWGAPRWENVMAVTDCYRPSDHNMVVADIRLP
jgi:endonuclease/exonuclease/phosphatase family metal-dependent hydrolase